MAKSLHPRDELLLLALDGEPSSGALTQTSAHVSACPVCLERAEALKTTLAEAERLYRAIGEGEATHAAGRDRLERALRQAGNTPDHWWTRGPHRSVAPARGISTAIAVAASLAALSTASLVMDRSARTPAAPRQVHARAATDPLPVAALTPGAVSALTAEQLCAGARPPRTVKADVRRRVLVRYGMERVPADAYELDALITLDLGGTVDPENLWPQPYASSLWNARIKDALERLLADEVCHGRVPLAQAQREIATDWVTAYKRRFNTEVPMPHHARSTEIDDDLEFEPLTPARTGARLPLMLLALRD
jgi:anti-sigma factor RsiW